MVNDIDDRSSRSRPVARKTVELTLDYDDNATTTTTTIELNGEVTDIQFVIPALGVGTQCTLSLEDGDGDELYTSGLQTESATRHIVPTNVVPLCGTTTVKVVTVGTQTADHVFSAKFRYT